METGVSSKPMRRITTDGDDAKVNQDNVQRFKRRMLEWGNPVEYVNNMYGCHPDDDDCDYFHAVFAKD